MSNLRPPRQFDLIAFDWDGTLFDSTQIIVNCIKDAVRDVGGEVPSDEKAAYVSGLALGPALALAAPDVHPDKYPELSKRYSHYYVTRRDDLVLFDGVIPMLTELRSQSFKIAVATGKNRTGLNDALASAELKDVFHSSRTADETAGKPDPQMLFELMEEFRVLPSRTLMIGDTSHDLLMAQKAGCASIGVSYGAHKGESLEQYNPLCIAHSVPQLHQWIKANG
jgi:phosphoglycolate phosphatase